MTSPPARAATRVALYGAGALGRRHLAALAQLGAPVAVALVDPLPAAYEAARQVFADTPFPAGSQLLIGLDTVIEPDVAIVATNARERAAVIGAALRSGARRLLVEKVLFTRPEDYAATGDALADAGAVAWVNCARRTYGSFAPLQDLVAGQPFAYRVQGTGWGLGCNLVHHLDEFAALAGTTELEVDATDLLPGSIPAKRAGYVEFLGTVRARAATGATFEARCENGPPGDRVVTVRTASVQATVSQLQATLTVADAQGQRTGPIDIPLQSRITADHVRSMLAGERPALPDYAWAAAVHRPMIDAFLGHLRRSAPDRSFDECPIT